MLRAVAGLDVPLAMRLLQRTPSLALSAVLSLGLGMALAVVLRITNHDLL
jgi:predicted lysophospholipase L1 biosynthesis ABC-type transport system permease subunit